MREDYTYGVTFHSDFKRFNSMVDLYCERLPSNTNVLLSPGMSGAVLAGAIMAKLGSRQPERKIRHVHMPRTTNHHRHKVGYVGFFYGPEERIENVICLVDDVIHQGQTLARCYRRLQQVATRNKIGLKLDHVLVWDVIMPQNIEWLMDLTKCGVVEALKDKKVFVRSEAKNSQ